MKIDIWSDIRCPFCYIGKKNLEKAMEHFPEREKIEIIWHSFQLDAELVTQPEMDSLQYFSDRKGVSLEKAKEAYENMQQIGLNAGIKFNFEHQKVANTYRGHLLLKLAEEKNIANEAEEALFMAQFIEGKNIDDEAVLIQIGEKLSLKAEDIKAGFASEKFKLGVEKDVKKSRELGISGVPFFVFNDKYGVSGAQPPAVLQQVLEKAWSEFQEGDKGLQIIRGGESCDVEGNCD